MIINIFHIGWYLVYYVDSWYVQRCIQFMYYGYK